MERGACGIQGFPLGKNGAEEAQSSFPAEIKGSRELWLLLEQAQGSSWEAAEDAACSPCPVASAGRAFPQQNGKFGSLLLFIQVSCRWKLMLGLPELCLAWRILWVPWSTQSLSPSHQMHFFVGFFLHSCCSVFHFSHTLGLL